MPSAAFGQNGFEVYTKNGSSSDTLRFGVGTGADTVNAYFPSGSNIGIGTASPTASTLLDLWPAASNRALNLHMGATPLTPFLIQNSGGSTIFEISTAGAITTGTMPDTGLSSNVALLNRDGQVFTGQDIFRRSSNSATAFQVQDASSVTWLDVDTTNGRVGVGTSAPTAHLDVTTASDTNLRVQRSGGSNFFITSLAGSSVAGTSGATDFYLRTNNTDRITLLSSGYVGIGSTAPLSRLDLGNVSVSTDTLYYPRKASTGHPSSPSAGMSYYNVADAKFYGWNGTSWVDMGGGGVAADSLDFTEFKDAMTLDASTDIATAGFTLSTSGTGKVNFANTGGVGIGTAVPGQELEVIGDISLPSSGGNKQIYTWSPTDGNWRIGMSASPGFTRALATSHVEYLTFASGAGQGFAVGDNVTGLSAFEVTGSGSSYNAYFRGNVGVASSSPSARLTVGEYNESTTQTNFTQAVTSAGVLIDTDYTANAYTPGLYWSTRNNNPTKPKAGLYLQETSSGTYMYFGTSNNYGTGITNNAMVIDYAGSVGIGSTSPRSALDTYLGTQTGAANDYEKAQFTMSGGGTVTWAGAGGKLKWTARFIAIPVQRPYTASAGYVDVVQPVVNIPAGQVYDGLARTADANGVVLNAWEALYCQHTVGGNNSAITYYIVRYTNSFNPPSNWLLVAAINGDNNTAKLGTGVTLRAGGSWSAGADDQYVLRAGDTMTGSLTGPGYISITGVSDASGNLRFSAANPYISASSYFIAPGGAYFNSGTVYTEATIQARGGIADDGGPLVLADNPVLVNNATANTTNPPLFQIADTATDAAQLDSNIELLLKRNTYAGAGIVSSDTTAAFIHFGDLTKAQMFALEYWNTDDTFRMQGEGRLALAVQQSTGNVGIGTTTAPGFPLHVYKDTTGWLSRFENTNAGGSSVYLAYGNGYGAYIDTGTDATSGTYALNVNKAGAAYLYVRGDGNVGINSANPQAKLDVAGRLRINAANDSGGNILFSTAANPYIVASSYIQIPGGLYVSGGTFYSQVQMYARAGIANDTASTVLSLNDADGISLGGPLIVNDNVIYLRSNGDTNHEIVFDSTVDGPQIRGCSGVRFYQNCGSAAETMRLRRLSRNAVYNTYLSLSTGDPQGVFQDVVSGTGSQAAMPAASQGIFGGAGGAAGALVIGVADDSHFIKLNSSANKMIFQEYGDFVWQTGSNSLGAGVERMRIVGTTAGEIAGNVGIGSANPQGILDIVGTTGVIFPRKADPDPTGVNGMIYYNTTSNTFRGYAGGAWGALGSGGGGGTFTLAGTSGSPQTITVSGDTLTVAAGSNMSTTAGATDTVTVATVMNPSFTTSVTTPLLTNAGTLAHTATGANIQTFSTNGSERMRIDSSGNVGIGTSAPLGRLDVMGATARTGTVPTAPAFYVSGTLSTGQAGPASGNIEFRHDNGTQGIGFGYNTIYQTGSNTNQDLNLLSRGSSPITLNAYAYSTGNVGIASTNPQAKLDVVGQVRVTAGSGTAPFVLPTAYAAGATVTNLSADLLDGLDSTAFASSSTAFIQNGNSFAATAVLGTNDANALAFETNNGEKMRILSGGNVGINSTNPQALFNVANATGTQMLLTDTDAGANAKHWGLSSDTGAFFLYSLTDALAATQRLKVASNGDFMIGNDPTVASRLHANKDDAANNSVTDILTLDHTTSGAVAAGIGAGIQFRNEDSSGSTLRSAAQVAGVLTDVTTGAYKGALVFSTANNAAPAERVRIDYQGNVGIGSSAPTSRLEIKDGDIRMNHYAAGSPEIFMDWDPTTAQSGVIGAYADNYLAVTANLTNDGTNWNRQNTSFGGGVIDVQPTIPFRVRYVASGANPAALTTAMVINSSGNVGIGSSSPGSLLTVGSTGQFSVGSTGIVTAGTWNGTAVAVGYGGTGATSLAGNGALVMNSGGTAITSVTGTVNQVLKHNGTTWVAGTDSTTGAGEWTRSAPNLYPTTSTDNVGIGTSAPAVKLEVSGQIKSAGEILAISVHTTRNYTLAISDHMVFGDHDCFNDVGQPDVTLPDSGTSGLVTGKTYYIRNASNNGHNGATMFVNPGSGNSIVGGNSVSSGATAIYVLSGTTWYRL